MKLARLLTILVLTFYCGNAAAQFNISRRPSEVGARELVDTLRIRTETGDLSIDYTNQAYLDALRRKRKRERNNVEFQAKLEMSQAGFSNWAGGGDNTFSGIGNIFFRHQHIRKRFSTDSKFEARYGMNYIEGEKFKNIDEFKIYEGLAWKISERWSYSASGNLRSQFTTGYKSRTDDTRVSTFMAPGFLDLAFGFTDTYIPFYIQT